MSKFLTVWKRSIKRDHAQKISVKLTLATSLVKTLIWRKNCWFFRKRSNLLCKLFSRNIFQVRVNLVSTCMYSISTLRVSFSRKYFSFFYTVSPLYENDLNDTALTCLHTYFSKSIGLLQWVIKLFHVKSVGVIF